MDIIKEERILDAIKYLQMGLEKSLTIKRLESASGLYKGYMRRLRGKAKKWVTLHEINDNTFEKFTSLYQKLISLNMPKITLADSRDMTIEEADNAIQENDGKKDYHVVVGKPCYILRPIREGKKIIAYYYELRDRHGYTKCGKLSREDVEDIKFRYNGVSGLNMTQKQVHSSLTDLDFTYQEFRMLLKALNLTKSTSSITDHNLEEHDVDENLAMIRMKREREFEIKEQEDKNRENERLVYTLRKENKELKQLTSTWKTYFSSLDFSDVKPIKIKQNITMEGNPTLMVYIADWHIGAYVDKDSIYENNYTEKDVMVRLQKLLEHIKLLTSAHKGVFDSIVICNLGDSLDGYNGQTTRGGHGLQQNMNNKEQFNTFTRIVRTLVESIIDAQVTNNICYIAVGDANHDGDFGYVANKALEMYFGVKYPEMTVQIFEKFMDYITVCGETFILCHGKDKEQMKGGLPLNLDQKTENYINEFILTNHLEYGKKMIHFIKADLHQSSTNFGKMIRYRNVSSLFGSSKWIHTNFGNTPPGIDYDVIYPDTKTTAGFIQEGHIKLV